MYRRWVSVKRSQMVGFSSVAWVSSGTPSPKRSAAFEMISRSANSCPRAAATVRPISLPRLPAVSEMARILQHKLEGKLAPVVALQLADPERQRPRELAEERQARVLVKASVEAQHPEAGAVIERRVLKRPATGDFDKLNVDLDALAGLGLFEELHLPWYSLPRPSQARHAEVPKDPLDRAHRHADLVHAPEPELGARSAIGELPPRLPDELDDSLGHPTPSTTGGYSGTNPSRPSCRQRTCQRRIVRALTPNRRPAAVGPCTRAKCSTISLCLTRHRYCSRTFTSLSRIIGLSPGTSAAIKAGEVNLE